MIQYSIQDRIRNGGAWAKANNESEQAHYFKANVHIADTMISACWKRLAKLGNAVQADHTPVCLACRVILDIGKGVSIE